MPTGLRVRLKQETADIHAQLEAQINPAADHFGRPELIHLLSRFLGYYTTCENQLAVAPPELAMFLDNRRKRELLVHDLTSFGVPAATIASIPLCPLPAATTTAHTLGRWYVLEGSTLGGQIVAKILSDRLALERQQCSFFLSYGDEVGQRWRDFCDLLEQHASPAINDDAVAAAHATFQSLSNWLAIP